LAAIGDIFFGACLAYVRANFVKLIFSAQKAVKNNSRADIGEDNGFDGIVTDAQGVRPALVVDSFDAQFCGSY
jgi:hypothetical protein